MPTAARRRRRPRAEPRRVAVMLTEEQCHMVMAVLSEAISYEEETVAEMAYWAGPTFEAAARGKRHFAAECRAASAVIRTGLAEGRDG